MKIEVKFEFECDNAEDYDKYFLEQVALGSVKDAESVLEERGFKIVQNSLQIKTLEENNLEKVKQIYSNSIRIGIFGDEYILTDSHISIDTNTKRIIISPIKEIEG